MDPFWTALPNVLAKTIGAETVFATDEFFATVDNLLNPEPAVFDAKAFTTHGKWMDGWETRRRRIPGHNWAIIQLGTTTRIRGIEIDTRYFTGNHSPHVEVEGYFVPGLTAQIRGMKDADGESVVKTIGQMGTAASPSAIEAVGKVIEAIPVTGRAQLVPRSPLRPGHEGQSVHYFDVVLPAHLQATGVTHLKLSQLPDGGIARMRVYGEILFDPSRNITTAPCGAQVHDLLLAENGGAALAWSDAHYGTPKMMLQSSLAPHMGDGWETARKLNRPPVLTTGPDGFINNYHGNDWAVLRLGARMGELNRVVVDTMWFKGNFPESCTLEGCDRPDLLALPFEEQRAYFGDSNKRESVGWFELVPRSRLEAHKEHSFKGRRDVSGVTHVRVTMFPDGGIMRLRAYGKAQEQSKM